MKTPLQKLVIERIDNAMGRNALIKHLEHCAKRAPQHHKSYFFNTILYINRLYNLEFDVVKHTANYIGLTEVTIQIFNDYSKMLGCEKLKDIADILQFKLQYVKNVRNIA